MPSRLPALPRRRLPILALALAAAGLAQASPAVPGTTPTPQSPATTTTCPLGTILCKPRPVSYAACRPNALLSFYQPGLPEDAKGRDQAQTDILARRVDSSNRTVYDLQGRVRLQRYDQLLRADHIRYNDITTAYDASGNVRYQDSTLLLSATRIQGSTKPDRSQADQVHYQLLQSRGNGVAGTALLTDPQHSHLDEATYSTCDPGDRVWEFRAKQINLNRLTGVGTAHDATLRYHDVPLLYLPYMTFPIDNRRRTGFLYPTFGFSSRNGFTYSQPYYLNLAPNYDATLTPRLYSSRGVMLGSQFRYLNDLGTGQFDAEYMASDRGAGHNSNNSIRPTLNDGARRYFVHYKDHTPFNSNWSLSINYNRASDAYYYRDFSNDLQKSALSVIASQATLNGHGQWWSAALGVSNYQSADPELTDTQLPYRRWPGGQLKLDIPLTRDLDLGLDSEAVAFRRVRSIEGNRMDLEPYLSWYLGGSYWFVKPRAAYRYTRYNLLGNYNQYVSGTPFPERTPTRRMPIYSIDSGLYFDRDAKWFGHDYTQTLEPRLYYLYVPYRNQNNLPTFDTHSQTFDFWQLFSTNQFSGADRQMNANNLTAAITSRLLDGDGDERASFSFGQIRYFDPQQVQLSRTAPATDYKGSSYVSQLSLTLNDRWRLDSAYQWSPNTDHNQVATFSVQRRVATDGILNFAYRYRYRFMEQLDASAVYPLSSRWRLLGRWNVALRDIYDAKTNPDWQRQGPKTLEAVAGVEYDSCCTAVRLVGRHYVRDTLGNTDNAVMVEIQFKGLGSTTPQTETFLRHAILGYQ